ncbi:MAG: class I SAM-dependent methyltransferase [Flavobacteriales bacterium]|nr:class I SAM-dependent methyltransferase [Flavobacteriales bacterium]
MNRPKSPGFDRVAPFYDVCKNLLFLGAIQRCQYFHLSHLNSHKKILVIGGGTGKIISEIYQHCEFDTMVYLDSSVKMVERAEGFIQKNNVDLLEKIDFQSVDVLSYKPSERFDVIVAPFVFDCFTDQQLEELGGKIKKWMSPRSLLLFSDFHESRTSIVSRTVSRFMTLPLYFALDVLCGLGIERLPNFNRLFHQIQFEEIDQRTFFAGVLQSAVYRLRF